MKITSSNSYDVNSCKKNIYSRQSISNNLTARDSVNFGSAKSGAAKILDYVNKKGFFAEFLIIDTFSMIIPRIWIGLNRDKENTGHLNYQAGMEEAGREVVSGPSMFLIPMGIFELIKHASPGAKIQKNTMEALSSAMRDVIQETSDAKTLKNKEKLSKKLSEKLFDKAFGDFNIAQKQQTKQKFVDILNRPSAKIAEFNELVKEINITNKAKTTLDSGALNFKNEENLIDNPSTKFSKFIDSIKNIFNTKKSKPVSESEAINSINSSHFFKDFKHYSNDIINNFTKQNFAQNITGNSKNSAVSFLEKIQNKKSLTRVGGSIATYFAVGAFLLELPKLYIKNKVSPAMQSAKRAKLEAEGGVNENK